MRNEQKKNLLAASLYIALAVMIVATVSVTVLSVAKRAKDNLPQKEESGSAPTAPTESDTLPPATSESTTPTEGTTEPPAPSEKDESVDVQPKDEMPDTFVSPASGTVSKGYEVELPVWSETMEDYRIHDGIDIVCDSDAEIYACADGTVESIYEDPLMGYAVTVYHGGGLRSTYMGTTGEYPGTIGVGVRVNAGQVLGWVGDSALIECAEPKHLHFVMTMDEETVDPQDYIKFDSATMNEYE